MLENDLTFLLSLSLSLSLSLNIYIYIMLKDLKIEAVSTKTEIDNKTLIFFKLVPPLFNLLTPPSFQ